MFDFPLASLIERKMMPIEVDAALCMRIRSSASGCTLCEDVCPAKGITITEESLEVGDCLKCGLCTAVCPTEALTLRDYSLSDLLPSIMGVATEDGEILLACGKAGTERGSSFAYLLPCLGLLPWEAWGWLLSHAHQVTILLRKEACSHCEISAGEGVWRQAVRTAEEWSGKQTVFKEGIIGKADSEIEDVHRRQFLSRFIHELKRTPFEVLSGWVQGVVSPAKDNVTKDDPVETTMGELERLKKSLVEAINGGGKRVPGVRRRLLHQLIKGRFIRRVESGKQTPDSFSLPVIHENCEPCGACTYLCPTGALTRAESNGRVDVLLNPSACLSCGLCEEVCWEGNVTMKRALAEELIASPFRLHTSHLCDGQEEERQE